MKHQMVNESLEWKLKMKIKETWGGNRHTKERRKYHRNYNIYREITIYHSIKQRQIISEKTKEHERVHKVKPISYS